MKVPAVAPHPHATPVMKSKYKKGETVLAKWTDCKLYSATVLKKIGKGISHTCLRLCSCGC